MLLASGWYPRAVDTPAARLAYYAEHFDLVEVNTSYYAVPAPETTAGWAEHTPPAFTFNVKAFGLLTGHPTAPAALPADLPPATYDAVWARFRSALEPLAEAGKLGVVLLQFPPWLRHGEAGKRRIAEAAQRCRPARVAVELRHGSWFEGANGLDTAQFLQRHGCSFVCLDMPQGHPTSVPPVLLVTAPS